MRLVRSPKRARLLRKRGEAIQWDPEALAWAWESYRERFERLAGRPPRFWELEAFRSLEREVGTVTEITFLRDELVFITAPPPGSVVPLSTI